MMSVFISRMLRRLASERGASTVIIALMMPALLGIQALAVDVTHVFVERRALQNAADAAALAAAVYLPTTDPVILSQARQAAVDYAALNGFTITSGDVVFSSDATANDRVTVRTTGEVEFDLAKSIGFTVGAVGSQGTAQIGIVGARAGVMPWGVEEPVDGFVFGDLYCLKLGSNGGGGACSTARQGNFHALDIDDLGNDSASEYRERIENGSYTVVAVGQVKNVASGNMNGPTQQGTGCSGNDGRLSGNTQTFAEVVETAASGYRVLDWTSPRLIIIPVVEFPNASEARVLMFSVFFLEDCGSNGAVTGRFIDTIVPGGHWAEWIPGNHATMARLVD